MYNYFDNLNYRGLITKFCFDIEYILHLITVLHTMHINLSVTIRIMNIFIGFISNSYVSDRTDLFNSHYRLLYCFVMQI